MSSLHTAAHADVLRKKMESAADQSSDLAERAQDSAENLAAMLSEFFQTKIAAPPVRLRYVSRAQVLNRPGELIWFHLHENGRDFLGALDNALVTAAADAMLGQAGESQQDKIVTAIDRWLASAFARRLASALFFSPEESARHHLEVIGVTTETDDIQLPKQAVNFQLFEVTGLTPDGVGATFFSASCDAAAAPAKAPEKRRESATDAWAPDLAAAARRTPVQLGGVIGTVKMTVGDLLDLQPESMLSIEGASIDNISLRTDGAHIISGKLGEFSGRRAVKIAGAH